MERKGISLKEQLSVYAASGYYRFHMPGHKRRMGELGDPYQIDITEIYGFDDLHHPQEEGILVKAQERAARLYGAEETHFLINGSTAGILSAISGCTCFGGELLLARNSHCSAYHGAELRNLKLWYLYPQCAEESLWINGRILSSDVEKSLQEHSKIEAVFITSPTYEGICTDIKAMVKICHNYGIPLIVDQAHGAHFPFSEYFPEDALKAGADVVIQSVHKTLPALTQTALLHIQGKLVDREKLHYYLSVYQSSSPSYVLMASIDSCMKQLEEQGDALYEAYIRRLKRFRRGCEDLRHLKMLGKESFKKEFIYDFDNSRLVISVGDAPITGETLMQKLRLQYHIEMEMATKGYVVGISTVADQEEDFQRLSFALHQLDETLNGEKDETRKAIGQGFLKVDTVMPLGMALEQEKEWIEISKAVDRIAGKYLYLYPPGIPLVVLGERLTKELCSQIKYYLEVGLELRGLDESGRINVVK